MEFGNYCLYYWQGCHYEVLKVSTKYNDLVDEMKRLIMLYDYNPKMLHIGKENVVCLQMDKLEYE